VIGWNKVTKKGYWQVAMDGAGPFANPLAVKGPVQALIDSGTSFIVGDPVNVKAFYDAIPGSKDATASVAAGYYTVPCDNLPTGSLTFGGVTYPIDPKYFNLGAVAKGSNDCIGALIGTSQGFWIVGDVFLRNVYSVFDFGKDQVGFAQLAS